ncbi:MAG: DUF1934 domain-containing protein [Oscillospiraceae bacterium]|nr:DUF1934 domain-containing protein [Oscillospiraceae bacterium]
MNKANTNKSNNKDVSINIRSIQIADDERDTTELFTCGKLHLSSSKGKQKSGNYTLSYDESGATGFGESKVSLDVTGSDMVVMRRYGEGGRFNASLVIEKGKKHHCHYGTPHGDFMVGISANDVRCDLNDKGGDLYLKYTVDVNSTLMSENEMHIDFSEISDFLGFSENEGE